MRRTLPPGLLLAAEDTIEPLHKPDELWTRCPSCEASGPNRYALTIRLSGEPRFTCRNGCPSERIGERLQLQVR